MVTAISPASGTTAGGTVVTVTGSSFTGATKVAFGGTAGTALTVVSATQLKITSPAKAAGAVDVQVTTPGGTSAAVTADKYTYVAPPPAPVVTAISPASGTTAGGTVVTVTGSNFTGATKVAFGGTAGTALTVVWATQLKITSPAKAAGAVDVQVTTPGGTSAAVTADKYTYVAPPPAPVVTAISPASGTTAGGTVVTVTGSNFTGATKVAFGGTAGTALTVVSATQLKITSPAKAAGAVDVQVTTPGGTSAAVTADKYTYVAPPPAPVVTAISPASGTTAGGTVVTVTGSNFTGATKVAFGGTAGTALTVVSATQLKITSPAKAAGAVDVQVTTPGGTSAAVTAEKNRRPPPPAPVVTAISPASGTTAGGTVVTVTGSNFTGATKVAFGGTAGTALTAVSATQLKITSPAKAAGAVDVQVTTPGGTSAAATAAKTTYVAPPPAPVVTAISPASGTTAGGTVVTVTGSNFTGATKVAFGGTAGTALTVVSATQLKITSPAKAAGAVDVQVTTPGGTSAAVTADKYTYVAPCAPIHKSGTLTTDELWTANCGQPYIIDSPLSVPASRKLTIQEGTIVKLSQSTSINVDGSLVTAGTAAAPVVFTSIKDDSIGGDTNGDGSASSPQPGDWNGIQINSGGVLDLSRARVAYGYRNVDGTDAGGFAMNDSVIQQSYYQGVQLYKSSAAPVLQRNTVTGSGASAMVIYSEHLDASKLDGNNGADNHGGLQLSGTIETSGTLTSGSLPLQAGSDLGYHLVVGTGATLTIPAGQIWKASDRTLAVNGSLVAAGTAAAPVVFTSIKDDSIGGDTNGDGSASSPQPGDWNGIQINSGGVLDLSRARVAYGYRNVDGTDAGGFAMNDSVIQQSYYQGVQLYKSSAAPVLQRNTVTGSGASAMVIYSEHLDASKLDGNNGADNHGGLQLSAPSKPAGR